MNVYMGIVKVHLTNPINTPRKSKQDSGIDIVKFNKDFKASDKKFIVYMSPGCGHCVDLYKYFNPLVKSLEGKNVKEDEDVVIAALYQDSNPLNNDVEGITPLAGNLTNIIKFYPTMFLYDNKGDDFKYDQDRSPEVLKQWMIKKLGIIVDKNVGKVEEGKKSKPVKKKKKKKKSKKKRKRKSLKNYRKKIMKYKRKLKMIKRIKRGKRRRGRRSKKIKSKGRNLVKAFTNKLLRL